MCILAKTKHNIDPCECHPHHTRYVYMYKYTEVIFETPFYCCIQAQPLQEMLQSVTTSITISIKICYNM